MMDTNPDKREPGIRSTAFLAEHAEDAELKNKIKS
jgi:hypothetical protein